MNDSSAAELQALMQTLLTIQDYVLNPNWKEILITGFLVSIVMMAGSMAAGLQAGAFNPNATEPFLSEQNMLYGISYALAALVPYWRGHTITMFILLLLAAVAFFSGVFGLWKHNRNIRKTLPSSN